jgi:FlaA1/EpsC-like NDP-sugar epimerase
MHCETKQSILTDVEKLVDIATGRSSSLFAEARTSRSRELVQRLSGARVLVAGGAGSVGRETVKLLAEYPVAALHVTDLSENYLADLVREIRNSANVIAARDFRTHTLDYGGAGMGHLLAHEPAYDLVLSFVAYKHVRGERDGYSLLSMIETNLLKLARFKEHLIARGHGRGLFSVSTDKAANPASLMGASKRAMEDVLFAHAPLGGARVTTARFANVAFSNGSLLQAFLRRLARGELLAVPEATRRYFVSPREAGEICLLASILAPDGAIVIPNLNPEAELIEFQLVVERLLHRMGFVPHFTRDEDEARALAANRTGRSYPVLLTPLDTGGEKPYEEFLGAGETAHDWLPHLRVIQHRPPASVDGLLLALEQIMLEGGDEQSLSERIRGVFLARIENFKHRASRRNLDQRL